MTPLEPRDERVLTLTDLGVVVIAAVSLVLLWVGRRLGRP